MGAVKDEFCHVGRGGLRVPISGMSDAYLFNTIRRFLKMADKGIDVTVDCSYGVDRCLYGAEIHLEKGDALRHFKFDKYVKEYMSRSLPQGMLIYIAPEWAIEHVRDKGGALHKPDKSSRMSGFLHATKDGEVVPVENLEDGHLFNIIAMHMRRLRNSGRNGMLHIVKFCPLDSYLDKEDVYRSFKVNLVEHLNLKEYLSEYGRRGLPIDRVLMIAPKWMDVGKMMGVGKAKGTVGEVEKWGHEMHELMRT